MRGKRLLRKLQGLLGDRELIYVGPRGVDALPLMPLGSLESVFSLIAPAGPGLSDTCMETISGVRPDLNDYSLDDDGSEAAIRFREALLAKLSRPSAVVPYSSSRTLSQSWLMTQERALLLGLFYEQQSCFDYKPWVESELRRWGIPTIPWTYVRALDSPSVIDSLDRSTPMAVRWPRSRGGAGIWLVRSRGDLDSIPEPPLGERFFCVAPYFEATVSVNVNACVFADGEVSIHGSSIQLVGIEICTSRPLGYAGNDFASIADLPINALQGLDSMARSLGSWLARHGYLGAFGFDALILGDRVLFVELNPRFQASSAVASRLDGALDRPDQYLNHIAAFLGLGAPDQLGLPDLVKEQEPLSHIVVYNGQGLPVTIGQSVDLGGLDVGLLPDPRVTIEPQGTLAAILWNGRVTDTGRELWDDASTAVQTTLKCFSIERKREERLSVPSHSENVDPCR